MSSNQNPNATSVQVLTKTSTENEIKTYFEKVLELKQSNEDFPVNLDEVCPLVYSEKGKAVRALQNDFIENEDYVCLPKMASKGRGGHNELDYRLSVSCLEYFIARKVRPVFEVYRRVFHKVAEQKQLSTLDLLELTIKGMRENHQELQEVKKDVLELKARTTTRPEEFTIAGFATLQGMHVNLIYASKLGKVAKEMCRKRNIQTGTIPDPRFGKVCTYPVEVLKEVFAKPIN